MTQLTPHFDDLDDGAPPMGLIVLETDETLEPDMTRYMSNRDNPVYVSRIASGVEVTASNLKAMADRLGQTAGLLPKARPYPVVGYGCTSASAQIGSEAIEEVIKTSCNAAYVTNPLRATVAHAADLGVSKFALVSPYIEEVNAKLREAFANLGITTDVFGSFGVIRDDEVVRISQASVVEAAIKLGRDPNVEAVFLSCTNLRTYDAIPEIEAQIGKPTLSSNRSLSWDMIRHLA